MIAFTVIVVFFIILVLSNEYRKWKQTQQRNKRHSQQRLLTTNSVSALSQQTDLIVGFIRVLGAHDKLLAEQLVEFRRTHRRELVKVRTIEQFAKVVAEQNFVLYQKIQDALEKASIR